jgi:hypothetical protein
MIPAGDLRKIAHAWLKEAEVLQLAKRYEGAVYLCGYAVEIALKGRICRALKWASHPSTRGDFEGYQSFRTHDLDILLHLSAREAKIKAGHLAEWSILAAWDPSVRSTRKRSSRSARGRSAGDREIPYNWIRVRWDAARMIAAAKTLLAVL